MIDLHIHTVNSDGDFKTKEILEKAELKKLKIISITDHNNINAYRDLEEVDISSAYSGKIIPGVELEFCYQGRLFDMLGYGINLDVMRESEIIKRGFVHSTVDKETSILNHLKSICDDLKISYTKDLKINSAHNMANDVLLDDIIGYEENKAILDSLGIYDRSTFYRKHFCEPSSPFYIDNTQNAYDVYYVTSLIHKAGGKAFFAHPFVYGLDNIVSIIDTFREEGIIDGIECCHRKHNEEQINFLLGYCDQYGLLKSGGSDFHIEEHYLGYANRGKYALTEEIIDDWVNDVPFFYPSSKSKKYK